MAAGDASTIGPELRGWDYPNEHLDCEGERTEMYRGEAITLYLQALEFALRVPDHTGALNRLANLTDAVKASNEYIDWILSGTAPKREDA